MKDNVKPGEKWEFNDEVARCFKNMLERSIPDYQSMRALSYELGTRFVQPDTLIVDAAPAWPLNRSWRGSRTPTTSC